MGHPVHPWIEEEFTGGFKLAPVGPPEEVRLDPPGICRDFRVLGIRQRFWQYVCRTAICFEISGARYRYERNGPIQGDMRTLPARVSGTEVDLAPLLLGDLRGAIQSAPKEVLTLLDLLATYDAKDGSSSLVPPTIHLGVAGYKALKTAPKVNLTEIQRQTLEAPRFLGHVAAISHKVSKIDGWSGHSAEMALVSLSLEEDAWIFHRESLWSEYDEGSPYT
jgi:hypothetical protein